MEQELNMRKMVFAVLAVPAAFVATPAAAQATGTVTVNGSVDGRCTAITAITGTIAVGELADSSTGFVRGQFATNQQQKFTVRCTTATVGLRVEAKPLLSTPARTTANYQPTPGYTARVNYTATLTAVPATGSTNVTVSDTSDATGSNSSETGAVKALGQRLSNTADNILLDISAPTADANKILEADTSYSGTVDITVSPTV
jgi:hypothetical protein